MKLLKRTYINLSAYVDSLAKQLENHDALSKAAIEDLSQKIAQTKVRYSRLKRERMKLEETITQTQAKVAAWEDRALELRESDQEKAIKCLKRKKETEKNLSSYQEQLDFYQKTETSLDRDLSSLSASLSSLKNKRNIFLAREASSEAKLSSQVACGQDQYDQLFDSWDYKIVSKELSCDTDLDLDPEHDSFEAEFLTREENEELAAELASLGK